MATLADLDAAIGTLSTDVDALIAKEAPAVDVQPQVDAVNAINDKVNAALAPPPPPA